MNTTYLTPFDFSEPVSAGRRRFWKQILPVTDIDYNGQKVSFDRDFHKDLELSFKDGAYDQVPLVFANAENQHNEDPRNFAGELLAVENRGDTGTWGLIETDRAGAKAIARNPKLGVSARIVQGVKKADGRSFNRAIRHVLLTMNPRVSGMEPWQAVDLSDEGNPDNEVVDLTAEIYKEESDMDKPIKRTADGKIDLSALSDEQFQSLLDLAATAEVDEDEDLDEDEEDEVDPDEVEDTTTTPKPKKKKSKTKITVEKESEGDPDDDEDEEEDETNLSDAAKVKRSADHATVRGMQIDLAEQKWNGQRSDYLRAGVPPFLLDLAEPVLKQPESVTLDLSEGESLDASATIRKMLDGVKGLIDLGPEVGHMVDLSDVHVDDADKAFLDEWDKTYG